MFNNVFPKTVPFEIMWKIMAEPERPQMTIQYGACALYTIIIRNAYCFTTVTAVRRMSRNITSYAHCSSSYYYYFSNEANFSKPFPLNLLIYLSDPTFLQGSPTFLSLQISKASRITSKALLKSIQGSRRLSAFTELYKA